MQFFSLLITFLFISVIHAQPYKVLESSSNHLKVEFDFSGYYSLEKKVIEENTFTFIKGNNSGLFKPGEPDIPHINFNIGIPYNSKPSVKILTKVTENFNNIILLPVPDSVKQDFELLNFDKKIYNNNRYFPLSPAEISKNFIMRYLKIASLFVYPYQYNPVSRELIFNKKIIIHIDFNADKSPGIFAGIPDKPTEEYALTLINKNEAKNFIVFQSEKFLSKTSADSYWFNPQKDYYKIYLKDKGIYRITFDYLVSAGVPINNGINPEKLDLFNMGKKIPIDIVDNNQDGIFNSGDYFQFAGYPPEPVDAFTNFNIYNNENVYWFSYQNDSQPLRYVSKDGFPNNWEKTYQTNPATIHYEKDLIYERLGYAANDQRDFWFWGKASVQGGVIIQRFVDYFPTFPGYVLDSNRVTLRVNMHGMTLGSSSTCPDNHKAYISLTDQLVGNAVWKNQESYTFEKTFFISEDSIRIFPTGNEFKVEVKGDACPGLTGDEIRINWYEFEYWRENRTAENNFSFQFTEPYQGVNRYWLYGWQRDNMKVYIPSKRAVINNPQIVNDEYNSVLFVDTLSNNTEYFCIGDDYFLTPDSIKKNQSSDIRNTSLGADYIIITHPRFMPAAEKLAGYRSQNLAGFSSPRIQLIDVMKIYNEFSYGLLNPEAIKEFIKYAFDNWQKPAPLYVVLMGDMSHDYRNLTESKHENFIPSLMYFAREFGLVASDNLLAAVSGNDISPDLAIGRLSCETLDEANTLVEKIINYPADNSKEWKQDVLLLASGLSEEDQKLFGFNNQSKILENSYLKPNGIKASKVFNYPDPNVPEDLQYLGSGPRMREEFNEGAVVANYYGHGGGGQWDLVFTNDDIFELTNDQKLPLVLSVTCYTAHFDDQDCFGEIFVKTDGKGAIGFWGSTALTYWGAGTLINKNLYNHIFSNKIYTVGNAILNAKSDITGYLDMVAQLTYLGDPAVELALPKTPDFVINPASISFSPPNPLKDDTIKVQVNIRNLGITFPGDSVKVELFTNSISDETLIGKLMLPNFGEEAEAVFNWIPGNHGLYNIIAVVNGDNSVHEADHSDNTAASSIFIFNISEPGIINPVDGFTAASNNVNFLLADFSDYINENITYFFEVDTSTNFSDPFIKSGTVYPENGIVKWSVSDLTLNKVYFWRVRVFDGKNFGNWSRVRSFSVSNKVKDGYYAWGDALKNFETYNVNYLENEKSLVLNSSLLPPRPSDETFIEDIFLNTPVIDSVDLTAITTDGTYIYFGNIWYYSQFHNPQAKSFIYKIGTGYNGTIKGEYYGTIPDYFGKIANQIFYYDGFIYIPEGNPYYLKRVDPVSGDTSSVFVKDGLLNYETGKPDAGSFYITSDGNYVYNLSLVDTLGNDRYVIRIFDPADNWNLHQPDVYSTSSYFGFSGFFAANGYIYPFENYFSGYMRKIRASDGFFDEEWITLHPFQGHYAWCFDWQNNRVYSSVSRSGFTTKISLFEGRYLDANGKITTPAIGPALKWNSVSYTLDTENSTGSYNNFLTGLNDDTKNWDTLIVNFPDNFSIDSIDSEKYPYLKAIFDLTDSSFVMDNPMNFKEIHFSYSLLPEIILTKNNFIVVQDSVPEGLPIDVNLDINNIGYTDLNNLKINYYLNNSDSVLITETANVKSDSSAEVTISINTENLSGENIIKAEAVSGTREFFTFNNSVEKNFFVKSDTLRPELYVTFDGEEVLNGDIVSPNPEIIITLKDNSPLPLDTSLIDISYTYGNTTSFLSYHGNNISTEYNPYPNSQFTAKWNPELPDGEHRLSIRARDASNNFFDSTSYSITFFVFNNSDLLNVYNYPNPFSSETYFTFQLTGLNIPDELYIKIYTVAGRLIREIKIPSSELKIGFNRFYWDGRDQDGDEIANGLYFYKTVSKFSDVTKTSIQKLAKIQ